MELQPHSVFDCMQRMEMKHWEICPYVRILCAVKLTFHYNKSLWYTHLTKSPINLILILISVPLQVAII